MILYDHQKKIIDENPKRTGLFLGTGSGKTTTALMLGEGSVLVICPKTQKEDKNWEREKERIGIQYYKIANAHNSQERKIPQAYFKDFPMTVVSKEEFRRDHKTYPYFDTVIIDEAHTCLGVTPNIRWRNKKPIPKTSQLFEALEEFLDRTNPSRFYLVTATIMKSPMTIWGAAKLLGKDWNFYEFRDTFYIKLPMPGRMEVWVPKKDDKTKIHLASLVKKIGYVGRLEDFFDVPDQTFKTIEIGLTALQSKRIKDMKLEYPEPIVRVGKIHQIENGVLSGDEFSAPESFDNGKLDAISDLSVEFPRMVIFAKYRAQIAQIEARLTKEGKKVITLTGDTKDRGGVISEANKASECVFIAQAQVSSGWELPEYPVMVFASRSYSFVDYDQSLGRIQRANNIKKNLYITLVVKGGVDEAVHKCIINKQDFNEKLYV